MKKLLCAFLLAHAGWAQATLIKKAVEYKDGDTVLEGVLVYDDTETTPRTGILVAHDWLGVTGKTLEKAEQFAKQGYVAFAADVYGKGVRPSGATAGQEAGKYKGDRKLFRKRMTLALKQLEKQNQVNKKSLFAVGYCFGGTGVIELAREGAKLKGVISVHGGLDSPEPALGQKIKTKVLVLHGADDPFVAAQDLQAFEQEMRAAKVDWQLVKYGNAVHSFTDKTAGTDNSKGAAYNANADARSWQAIIQFLAENR
ncbi:MAG: dienelactone hydrolase family protein [Bdellovibrionales bacterium]